MKYTKKLTIVAIAYLAISIVHFSKSEQMHPEAEPLQTVALDAIDEPIKDGLKTKIFTIIDRHQDNEQTT